MLRALLPLLLVLLLLPACGKKGPLRPKLAPLPAAPVEFGVRQQGEALLLSWRLPIRNQDDSPLAGVRMLHLYRSEFDPLDDCPDCREATTPYRRIDLDYLQQVRRQGERLLLVDDQVSAGGGYRYRLAALGAADKEGAAAWVKVVVQTPPPSPRHLAAQPLDRQVRLSWEAATPPAGTTLLGYNVYRRSLGEAFGDTPVNPAPLAEPRFDHFGLINGQTYVFGLTTLVQGAHGAVESPLAETPPVTPEIGQ